MSRKIKATPKQTKLAKELINNQRLDKPKSKAEVMKSVGYNALANTPNRVLESVGFKQALRDLGLTEELITSSLVADINAKPEKRLGELKLGAEMLQMVRQEDKQVSENKNTYNFIFSPEVQDRVKIINEDIKKLLTNVPETKNNLETE